MGGVSLGVICVDDRMTPRIAWLCSGEGHFLAVEPNDRIVERSAWKETDRDKLKRCLGRVL